jgi:hypothetical protein
VRQCPSRIHDDFQMEGRWNPVLQHGSIIFGQVAALGLWAQYPILRTAWDPDWSQVVGLISVILPYRAALSSVGYRVQNKAQSAWTLQVAGPQTAPDRLCRTEGAHVSPAAAAAATTSPDAVRR